MGGDGSDILYDTGLFPGLELEVVLFRMSLVAHLGDDVGMPACGIHDKFGFMEGAAERLLYIDMLALVEAEHHDREMVEIRNGGGDCLELIPAFVEHLTEIPEPLGFGIHLQYGLALGSIKIYIAKGDDVHHAGIGKCVDYLVTAISDSNVGDLHLVFTFGSLPFSGRSHEIAGSESKAGGSGSHALQEISTG